MKKKLTFISALFIAFGSIFFVSSCNGANEITGIHMSSEETVIVPYGNFSYEGINVTVDFKNGSSKEIPLVEDMISVVERFKFFKIGEQKVEVTFRSRYSTIMPIDVVLNQFKDSYELVGYECTYDGLPHVVNVNQELPEGATITYPTGNMFVNAGTYEVKGVISKDGYESKTLTTTLIINQADREGSDGIVFNDTTLVYNGEMRGIEATNVPEGIEVSYETFDSKGMKISKVVNAGEYKVVAHFNDVSPNYKKIADKEARLIIQKADYDLSNVRLEDAVKTYDGKKYEAQIINASSLPKGVSVAFDYYDESGTKVTECLKVGKYKIVANFLGGDLNNYNQIKPMEASLIISKRIIKISDKVFFEDKAVNFDEETHSLTYTGNLPNNVNVTYENNDQVYAGEYQVKAIFSCVDPNEAVDVPEMTAYLIINRVRRSVPMYNEETKEYDPEIAFSEKNIKIVNGQAVVDGYNEEVFRLASISFTTFDGDPIVPENFEDGKTYKYYVKFEYIDENMNSSVILTDESDNFTYHEVV